MEAYKFFFHTGRIPQKEPQIIKNLVDGKEKNGNILVDNHLIIFVFTMNFILLIMLAIKNEDGKNITKHNPTIKAKITNGFTLLFLTTKQTNFLLTFNTIQLTRKLAFAANLNKSDFNRLKRVTFD